MPTPLAWLQLRREPVRLCVALAGVAFAVILVFMQLGFDDALFDSAVRVYDRLVADLVLISPQSLNITALMPFSRRRLYQAAAMQGVAEVVPVYMNTANWRNPYTGSPRVIFVAGFDPSHPAFAIPEVSAALDKIRLPDQVVFDSLSRPEFGPIAQDFRAGRLQSSEVNNRKVTIAGLFEMGTSFDIDGTLITSDLNFLRLFGARPKGLIDLGLIRLRPGADAEAARAALATYLPKDVEVLTKAGLLEREKTFWRESTPIGFIFTFGSIMGLVVGGAIVYQILFADVSAHLHEYATLKAIGYRDAYLFGVVLQQAWLVAVLGYLPGIAVATWLFQITERATRLPLRLGWWIGLEVLTLTLAMCSVAGLMALRKLRSADPA